MGNMIMTGNNQVDRFNKRFNLTSGHESDIATGKSSRKTGEEKARQKKAKIGVSG